MKERKKKKKLCSYDDRLPEFCIDKNIFNETFYTLNLRYWDKFLIGITTSYYVKYTTNIEDIYKIVKTQIPKDTLDEYIKKYNGEIIEYEKFSVFSFKDKRDIRKCKKDLNFMIQTVSLFM
jgi:hypothetical protein